MQALTTLSTRARTAATIASSIGPKVIPTMAAQVPPAAITNAPSVIPAVVAPTSIAAVPSIPSIATTLSTLTRSLKVSSTSTSIRGSATKSLITESASSVYSTATSTPTSITSTQEAGASTSSAVPGSVWEVNGDDTGTKIIIYGLLGFFFGIFVLAILVDMKRRPDEVKENFRSIGRFFRHFPKAVGRCIYKGTQNCFRRRKTSNSNAKVSLNRQFEHAAIIDRLAAKLPGSCIPSEKLASSGDASSNTVVVDDSNQEDTTQESIVPIEGNPESPASENVKDSIAVPVPDETAPRQAPISTPAAAHFRENVSEGVAADCELEAGRTEPRRPTSSHYSVAIADQNDENSRKPEAEPIQERDETAYRTWTEWEASRVQSP